MKTKFFNLRWIPLTLISILSIFLFTCEKNKNNGVVNGNIFIVDTEQPISGVTVEAGGKTATSNSGGNYSISNIPTGSQQITANKSDYENYSKTINITTDTKYDIYMTSNIQTGNLYGYVKNLYSLSPLQNVKITVAGLNDWTDASGHYQLPNVPQGEYIIKAELSGFITFEGAVYLYSTDKQYDINIEEIIMDIPCPGTPTVTDADGNVYNTVKIGNQCWMAENLNYNAGSGSYCYSSYTPNCDTYGRLYKWEIACNVCPDGWHLPTDDEWDILKDYLHHIFESEDYIGGKLKERGTAHWLTNNYTTNESGFTALPGGYYQSRDGIYYGLRRGAYFWSATEYDYDNSKAWYRDLKYDYFSLNRMRDSKTCALSVRCVKD